MNSARRAANVVGIGALLLGVALAAFVQYASLPLPPPTNPLEREAISPHHDMQDYRQVRWYHDEDGYSPNAIIQGKKKVALITGGNSGIGLAVAEELCRIGVSTVVITSRSLDRGRRAANMLVARGSCEVGQIIPMELDLANQDAVRDFAAAFRARVIDNGGDALNYFAQNAGGAILKQEMDSHGEKFGFVTSTGHEYSYVGNYLGHFLLLNLLLDLVEKGGGRISVASSNAHSLATRDLDSLLPMTGSNARRSLADEPGFLKSVEQYGNTKLLQIHMCFELQRRLGPNSNVTIVPLTPGYVNTNIGQVDRSGRKKIGKIGNFLAQPPMEGAKTTLHALLSPSMGGTTGYFLQPYWSPLHRDSPWSPGIVLIWEVLLQRINWGAHLWLPGPDAHRREFAQMLWEQSLKAVGLISSN